MNLVALVHWHWVFFTKSFLSGCLFIYISGLFLRVDLKCCIVEAWYTRRFIFTYSTKAISIESPSIQENIQSILDLNILWKKKITNKKWKQSVLYRIWYTVVAEEGGQGRAYWRAPGHGVCWHHHHRRLLPHLLLSTVGVCSFLIHSHIIRYFVSHKLLS